MNQEPLTHGIKVISNTDGSRNSHTSHSEVMFSLDGKPQENTGRTIGAALAYSGNYKLRVRTDDSNYHHFFAGINEENSEYHLPKGEVFVTPPLVFTYSDVISTNGDAPTSSIMAINSVKSCSTAGKAFISTLRKLKWTR